MALPAGKQLKYWGIAAAVLLALIYMLGDILLPFIIGGGIAYLLDPVADRLERWGLSRGFAVLVISVAFLVLFIVLTIAVVPELMRQAIGLVNALPDLARDFRGFLTTRFPNLLDETSALGGTIASLADTVKERGLELLNTVIGSAISFVNVLFLLFVVPVVTIYLLIDWDRLIARIDDLLPRDHAPTIRRLAGDMDRTLAQFLRGQGMVCVIQGTFYAVALMAAGLNFGLIIGVIGGLLSFIPFVGSITGFVLAVGFAAFQFWGDWLHIALIGAIFVFGQVVEGNILTPKLVGSSVGLHPVWLLIALSAFGSLFGFAGMLLAVPLAAMAGVLVRFMVDEYKSGRLYQGVAGSEPVPDTGAAPGEEIRQDTAAE